MDRYEIGIIGLGTMGRNFLLNLADSGFRVCGFDVDAKCREALERESGTRHVGTMSSLDELVSALEAPRKILILVPQEHVDSVVEDCLTLAAEGDCIIDGGNSNFKDTERRSELIHSRGLRFLGVGISGGEEGARNGASIMAGGGSAEYETVRKYFESVAASSDGEPCAAHVGSGSAGHFVKMVHNGIEYGLMQIIAEAYDLLRKRCAMRPEQIADVFEDWNKGRLKSFLFEITVGILRSKDDLTGKAMVDVISDRAGQKGTGRWASQAAMDLGIAVPNIDVAVTQRGISALSELRGDVDLIKSDSRESIASDIPRVIANLEEAVYCASSVAYLQGFHLMAAASKARNYNIDLNSVAAVWRAGCIIRSAILAEIASVLAKRVDAGALLSEPETSSRIASTLPGLESTVVAAAKSGVPAPGLSAAFNYLLSMSSNSLPTNLIQAQRDRFGSHTFKRVDREGDFHNTDWE